MKKGSTGATKQSRNISQQKLTIGLGLGDRNSWCCVLDEAGQIPREQRVRTNAKALREVFGALPRSRIALEIGTHSPWISRLLSELTHLRVDGLKLPGSQVLSRAAIRADDWCNRFSTVTQPGLDVPPWVPLVP
jgi:hypothetical protein